MKTIRIPRSFKGNFSAVVCQILADPRGVEQLRWALQNGSGKIVIGDKTYVLNSEADEEIIKRADRAI